VTSPIDQSVGGDADTWMLFDRLADDGQPFVILARTGNSVVEDALRDKLVTVVHCQADPTLVNEAGMPQHSDRLYAVEEGLAAELALLDFATFHVASVTGDGERRIVFAHAAPIEWDAILERFDIAGYSLAATIPSDRAKLIGLVTPTVVELQLNGDRSVISNLEKNGDTGLSSRKTDFWFYGPKDRLNPLAVELEAWGYGVDHWLDDPTGVVLTREMPVDFSTFLELTPILVRAAERHDVVYDGWETFVVRPVPDLVDPVGDKPKSLLSKLFGAKKN
jgi:hypothetical protein